MIKDINWFKLHLKKSGNKIRNAVLCHTQLRSTLMCDLVAPLPKSTHIPHPHGIVVGAHVEIGENCTIGAVVQREGYPKIGNNVDIGAGSIVVKNISENCVAVGNPAKVIKKLDGSMRR